MANTTAIAPSALTPPTTLGGTTVTVGGATASLFFVSSRQINAVLSPSTPLGTQSVVVTSASGTFSATVIIDKSAPPGLFSLLGTGTHDGAILNAVTFALGAFSVTTNRNSTFLALFATGLDLSVTPVVTVGGVPVTVQFFGASPCCMGLQQINVQLPPSLAGAGRVEVVVHSGAQVSNAVEIVLLPNPGQGPFAEDQENETRSRELAAIASVPGTSLALLTDENDDVVRVIDVSQRKVINVIPLPKGAEPVAIAVNAAATLAVVAERGRGRAAILNLSSFTVTTELDTGLGPVAVAIAGNNAVVVNGDADTASILDLTAKSVLKTVAVGRGPRAVAADAAHARAYVTNEDDGTISVLDLAALTVVNTISLGAQVRPAAIQLIPGSSFAVVTVPSAGNMGEVLIVNITTGTFITVNANPDRSGGSSDVAVNGSTVFFANQTGASVSSLTVSTTTGQPTGAAVTIKADLGARALAIDVKDHLLLVTNEGSGTVVLVNLANGQVAGRIDGVRSGMEGDDDGDDHSDHDHSGNLPVVASVSPATAHATSTFTITITGTGLTGATDVIFVNPANVHGNGKGKGDAPQPDPAFAASNIQVNSGGTQLTATIKVTAAALGPRVVLVHTPGGESAFTVSVNDTVTVVP